MWTTPTPSWPYGAPRRLPPAVCSGVVWTPEASAVLHRCPALLDALGAAILEAGGVEAVLGCLASPQLRPPPPSCYLPGRLPLLALVTTCHHSTTDLSDDFPGGNPPQPCKSELSQCWDGGRDGRRARVLCPNGHPNQEKDAACLLLYLCKSFPAFRFQLPESPNSTLTTASLCDCGPGG